MKPVELPKQLECDDGIFNVNWTPRIRQVECEWKPPGGAGTPCGRVSARDPITEIKGNYWCVECGLVMCLKHRKGHSSGANHARRLARAQEGSGERPAGGV
jgi:hypothetical protein